MNAPFVKVLLTFALSIALVACDNTVNRPETSDIVIGFTNVPLDAQRDVIRNEEAALGNLITDAMLAYVVGLGEPIDGVLINGGGIRYNIQRHPDGIYPAGELTEDDIKEMLPFGNTGFIVQMTGSELKSTLERSVHALPVLEGSFGTGAFLQVSANFRIIVDLDQAAQVLNELDAETTIASPGGRIVSVLINGQQLSPDESYQIFLPSFIASGEDGYLAVGAIPDNDKKDLGLDLAVPLASYFRSQEIVTPIIEGRIIIN